MDMRSQCATDRRHPSAWAFSADSAKLVHLVRHGQGTHNVEAALRGVEAYKMISLMDAPLDSTGRTQARDLGIRIKESKLAVDIILVSPMTRALQTATEMFPESVEYYGNDSGRNVEFSSALPRKLVENGEEHLSPEHRKAPPKFLAIELAREAFGGHPCDQRRSIRILRNEFPHVDFSLIYTDDDTWHDPIKRETVREVAIRSDKCIDIIRSRPERNIVVVSHGVLLETLLNRCSLACIDENVKARRFDNAEMRSIIMGGWIHPNPYAPDFPDKDNNALTEIERTPERGGGGAVGGGATHGRHDLVQPSSTTTSRSHQQQQQQQSRP